ncbi:MAG: hypothetical protein CVU39_24870 [Chloroflexi bacterium HGW-Chloroflexi-10]|nr:MAG: hypothetical protein CVU39_24870 [Chloroflexi bacterium HGW-Chloroflexi-10]
MPILSFIKGITFFSTTLIFIVYKLNGFVIIVGAVEKWISVFFFKIIAIYGFLLVMKPCIRGSKAQKLSPLACV